MPRKRLSCDSEIVQGSSVKRIKSFPLVEKDDDLCGSVSPRKSIARHVPSEQAYKGSVPFDDAQRPPPFQSSDLDTVSVLLSISARLMLCQKPLELLQRLLSRIVEYRHLVAAFINKHFSGTEDHDFIMLCQIM